MYSQEGGTTRFESVQGNLYAIAKRMNEIVTNGQSVSLLHIGEVRGPGGAYEALLEIYTYAQEEPAHVE